MKIKNLFIALVAVVLFIACGGGGTAEKKSAKAEESVPVVKELNTDSPDSDQYVKISTTMGDIVVKLYRETPLHRKNFVNLVMNGFYDGQIFYRVKPGSLIQTGDGLSRTKPDDPSVGTHDDLPSVTEEIDPGKRYHKRGALAAASVNQGQYSSGSHFYIIAGGSVKDDKLDESERLIYKEMIERRYIELQLENNDEIRKLRDNGKKKELGQLAGKLKAQAKKELQGKDFKYTKSQRNLYKKEGGAPQFDPYYTVFGEVLEGLDVVDSISRVRANPNGLPYSHVKITKMTLLDGYAE